MNQAIMIAAKAGCDDSLKRVGLEYKSGHVTKDEYASILRAHKNSRDEMKSQQRTKAKEIRALWFDDAR